MSLLKKILLSSVAALALIGPAVTPAHAVPVEGQKCRFNSATDVTAEAQTQTGVIEVGPLAIVSTDRPTVECQLYVNGVAQATAYVNATILPPAVDAGVYVAIGAGPMSAYPVYIGTPVIMCTFAHFDGQDWFWKPNQPVDPNPVGIGGVWAPRSTLGTNYAQCAVASQIDPNPPVCPILLRIDQETNNAAHLAETWQDCEPYDPLPLPID